MAGTLAACLRPLSTRRGSGTSGGGGRSGGGLYASDVVCSLLLPLCLCAPGFTTHPSSAGLLGLVRQGWRILYVQYKHETKNKVVRLLAVLALQY